MKSWPLLFSLLFLVISSNTPAACAVRQLPAVEIMSAEAPSEISPNEKFTVLVEVDYSESYSTDIAILETTSGFVLASKGLIVPAGRNSFAFQLTGRDQPGLWILTVAVRVWWSRGWYMSQNGATLPFQITVVDSRNATLAISSNASPIVVKVDGVSQDVHLEGIEISAERGLHTIEVQPRLSMANGTRVIFDYWSDGVRSSRRMIYLSGRLDFLAIYATEYLLTVESDVGETVGAGWYPARTNATFGVIEPAFTQDSTADQVTYEFIGWSGDSDSNSPVSSVIMDGPKTILAGWSETPTQMTTSVLELASLFFLACSGALILLAAALRKRDSQVTRTQSVIGRTRTSGLILILVLCTVLTNSSTIHPANASEVATPDTITMGKATWYHWRQAASDTLLIWLGGGIVEPTALLVNPYEFESYNTMRFIQDLSKHYDVLALKKGSLRHADSTLNRTFFREPYPGSNDFVQQIRSWSYEREYTYLYIIGYSVGAMAAARETVLAHPEDWTSPNGLIIITTMLSERMSYQASDLRASVLLLYGDKVAPEFIVSGQAFYESTPEEGWRDKSWFHKEFHVIPEVEHEVWTIRDTGEYDNRAVTLIIRFIETCKGMQFQRALENAKSTTPNHTLNVTSVVPFEVRILSVASPKKVMIGEVFQIAAKTQYGTASNCTIAIVTLDSETSSIMSASKSRVSGNGEIQMVNILFSGERERQAHFSLIPLIGIDDDWVVMADQERGVIVEVTDLYSVTVIVGYPGVAVEFDGKDFEIGADGKILINATQGQHVLSVPRMIVFQNESRAVFQEWNTTSSSSDLRLSVSRDVCLLAVYLRQYYLDVKSVVGQPSGTGWHDDNSVGIFRVVPILVSEGKTYVFAGWTGDASDITPASSIIMNSPKNVRAMWRELNLSEVNTGLHLSWALFIMSLAVLLGSLLFVWMSLRHIRDDTVAHAPRLSAWHEVI